MYKVIINKETREFKYKDDAINFYVENYKTANRLKIVDEKGKIICKKAND